MWVNGYFKGGEGDGKRKIHFITPESSIYTFHKKRYFLHKVFALIIYAIFCLLFHMRISILTSYDLRVLLLFPFNFFSSSTEQLSLNKVFLGQLAKYVGYGHWFRFRFELRLFFSFLFKWYVFYFCNRQCNNLYNGIENEFSISKDFLLQKKMLFFRSDDVNHEICSN